MSDTFGGDILRQYGPDELRPDGYPLAWREINDVVVQQAGYRCIRCGHPYRKGEHGRGEWSPCDEYCTHLGPGRHRPTEVEYRAAVPEGYPPIIGEDGWVAFDDGVFEWLVERGVQPEARWRILTVHHLIGDKANCYWWNLTALCQRCHLTIQGRVRMAQTYPFEHSEWFKPYAAGFYAWAYRGQELTREETMERLDELLALELQTS